MRLMTITSAGQAAHRPNQFGCKSKSAMLATSARCHNQTLEQDDKPGGRPDRLTLRLGEEIVPAEVRGD